MAVLVCSARGVRSGSATQVNVWPAADVAAIAPGPETWLGGAGRARRPARASARGAGARGPGGGGGPGLRGSGGLRPARPRQWRLRPAPFLGDLLVRLGLGPAPEPGEETDVGQVQAAEHQEHLADL